MINNIHILNNDEPIKKKSRKEIGTQYGDQIAHRWDWLGRANMPIGGSEKALKDIVLQHKDIDNPALFIASLLEEGGDKFQQNSLTPEDREYYRNSAKEGKFPISGAGAFGLDTIGDRVDEFIKKGYLDADFKNRIKIESFTQAGEGAGAKTYNSANFRDIEDVILAKKAFFKAEQESLNNFIKKNNIDVSDNVKNLLTVAAYNAGPKGVQDALLSWKEEGLLDNDKILRFKPKKYTQIWEQGMRRVQGANMLINEDKIPGIEMKWNRPVEQIVEVPKKRTPSDMDFANPIPIDNINLRPKI